MFKKIIYSIVILFVVSYIGYSQDDQVRTCLKLVASGKVSEVKMQMADLLADYPDDPGVQLLHGIVLDDAYKAVDIYEKIIKKNPNSEWSDHAFWRLVQFYAIVGNVDRASEELANYRKAFPTSEFLITASDAVRYAKIAAKGDAKVTKSKKKETESEVAVAPKKEAKETKKKEVKEVKEVKETPKETKETKEVAEDDSDAKTTWGLQVGVYSSEEVASQEKEKFQQMRLRTVVMNKKIDGAMMYAVVIGNYSTKDSAEQAKLIVQNQCGCSPIIIKK
jgi:cell division septation protein DedD